RRPPCGPTAVSLLATNYLRTKAVRGGRLTNYITSERQFRDATCSVPGVLRPNRGSSALFPQASPPESKPVHPRVELSTPSSIGGPRHHPEVADQAVREYPRRYRSLTDTCERPARGATRCTITT